MKTCSKYSLSKFAETPIHIVNSPLWASDNSKNNKI